MDRDEINTLHYLYINGKTHIDALSEYWWSPDTIGSIDGLIVSNGNEWDLPRELLRFMKEVETQCTNLPKPGFAFGFPLNHKLRKPGEPRPCFIAMSYRESWFETVKDLIMEAASDSGYQPIISLDLNAPGSIPDQIWQDIRKSDVIIADITGNNPNVYYEVGLAHALGKEVIILNQDQTKPPFDISTSRIIYYQMSDLTTLKINLESSFSGVSRRYPFD
jgi:hypothetical protein